MTREQVPEWGLGQKLRQQIQAVDTAQHYITRMPRADSSRQATHSQGAEQEACAWTVLVVGLQHGELAEG